MGPPPTPDAGAASPPLVKATTSSSSDMYEVDTAIIAGVIAAVFVTLLIVLVLITVYLYKNKGSYHTQENILDGDASKALQMEDSTPSQEKREYFM
ncbi:small cell adhesion glycoprotein isoform 2-T2 [Rhinophrynus dorsalis]